MKKINAYEYEDLTSHIQDLVFSREINAEIEFQISLLDEDLANGEITEKEYYRQIGCSKYYAETTAWFVPSYYYEKHKKELTRRIRAMLKRSLFSQFGGFISELPAKK